MARKGPTKGIGFLGVGFELAAAVAGLTLLGYWIDRHFESEPWGLLIGLTVGLVGGLYNMVRGTLAAVRRQTPPKTEGSKWRSWPDEDDTKPGEDEW